MKKRFNRKKCKFKYKTAKIMKQWLNLFLRCYKLNDFRKNSLYFNPSPWEDSF